MTNKELDFGKTIAGQEIASIELTAPVLLKGKKLGDVMSIKNLNEVGAIVDQLLLKARRDELNRIIKNPSDWAQHTDMGVQGQARDRIAELEREIT
jgi:hypothetical protein